MRPLCPDNDEGDPTVKKVSNDLLSINDHNFTFISVVDQRHVDCVLRETPLEPYDDVAASVLISNFTTSATWSSPLEWLLVGEFLKRKKKIREMVMHVATHTKFMVLFAVAVVLYACTKVLDTIYGPKAGTMKNENPEKVFVEIIWKSKTGQIGWNNAKLSSFFSF